MKTKFLLIITIFSLLIIICTNCFAFDFTYTNQKDNKDYTISLSDDLSSFKYIYILYRYAGGGDKIFFFGSNDNPIFRTFFSENMDSIGSYDIDNNFSPFYYGAFIYDNISLMSTSTINDLSLKTSSFASTDFGPSAASVYANHVIYNRDKSEVVFQGAPQEEMKEIPLITQTLVEQTTQVGMKPLTQIKTLLPIVIVVIVGLIGFWKAWRLLLKQLRKA